MKTFEQNLEELRKSMEDETQGFNKKAEGLIVQMQTEFQEGATCPLTQYHKEFINFLRVNGEIPALFKAWANGVHDYEFALQLALSRGNLQNLVTTSKPITQQLLEKALGGDLVVAKENTAPSSKPTTPARTNVKDWNDDL